MKVTIARQNELKQMGFSPSRSSDWQGSIEMLQKGNALVIEVENKHEYNAARIGILRAAKAKGIKVITSKQSRNDKMFVVATLIASTPLFP